MKTGFEFLTNDHLINRLGWVERTAERAAGNEVFDAETLQRFKYKEIITELNRRFGATQTAKIVRFKQFAPQIEINEKSVDWFPNFRLAHNGYMEIS